ncbi:MAG: divergent polysaccharide deacetylase family protein [Treponema sp.]|nr:divergent polysaccharide deacetylase family protein [Treponema sp.]
MKSDTRVKKPKKTKNSPAGRKKAGFEDGVRSVLVAGIVVCAVVLGAAGIFAARSVLGGGFTPPPSTGDAPAEAEGSGEGFGTETFPELEDAIRQLEADRESGVRPVLPGVPAAGKGGEAGLPSERRGILVFVIDDAGNNLKELDPFLAFPGPLTIAVLPGLPYSAEAAKKVRDAKKEVFLHQPMEPLGGQDPGPGAIKTGMDDQEIRQIITKNLAGVWPVAGMNNHEGSKVTMDPEMMRTVLELCRENRIHFLDSRTTADTAAPGVAADMGFAIARRDVFLDNEQGRDEIIQAIEQGCRKAERDGLAVMIGHAWSPRLAGILAEMYPGLVKKGFFLTTVSGILDAGK